MQISPSEAEALYAEESVADYRPEPVTVQLMGGSRVDACCYILPREKTAGANGDYAAALWRLASRLDFPAAYLDEIRLP